MLAAFVALDTLKAGGAARVFREQGADVATVTLMAQCVRLAWALVTSHGVIAWERRLAVPAACWAAMTASMAYAQATAASPADAALLAMLRVPLTAAVLRGAWRAPALSLLGASVLALPLGRGSLDALGFTVVTAACAAGALHSSADCLRAPDTTAGMHVFGVGAHALHFVWSAAMRGALPAPVPLDSVMGFVLCTALCGSVAEMLTERPGAAAVEVGNALSLVAKRLVFTEAPCDATFVVGAAAIVASAVLAAKSPPA